MGKVDLTLERMAFDINANEAAYRFRVINGTQDRIRVLWIEPRVPKSVEVVASLNSYEAAATSRKRALCDELTMLLENHRSSSDPNYHTSLRRAEPRPSKGIREFINSWSPLYIYTSILERELTRYTDRKSRQAIRLEITAFSDAERALSSLFEGNDSSESRKIFTAKMAQLQAVEQEIGSENALSLLIDPADEHTSTYIFKFRKQWFNSRRVGFAVQLEYDTGGSTASRLRECHDVIVISPKAHLLILLAMLFSWAGVLLKLAIQKPELGPLKFYNYAQDLLFGPAGVGAAIIAILLYVVFDRTEFARKLASETNWRTAIIVGMIAGLFGDQVMTAIRIILGIKSS